MANLQATKVTSSLDVQANTFIKLGQAYLSSGGSYAHFGLNSYYNGSAWVGSGPAVQLVNNTFNVLTSPATVATTPFSVDSTAATIDATATKILVAAGNSTTNSTLGIGAAAGTAATDGKLLVNAAGTAKPFLEVTNCLGNGSTSTSTFSVFKGYLGIKIGANVGPATAVDAGTYYLRLWSNA
jgi:hypothetical protein